MNGVVSLTPDVMDVRLPSTAEAAEHIKSIGLHGEGLVKALRSLVAEADAATAGASASLLARDVAESERAALADRKVILQMEVQDLQSKAADAEARVAKAEKALEAIRKSIG